MADLDSDSLSSGIELAGSASVDLEPANVTSFGQRCAETRKAKNLKKTKKIVADICVHPDSTTVLDLKAFYFL